jgi:50S ribosomal protein L16 3-hydroxylase
MPRPFGPLTSQRFLARHWQRRPLLVRGAFPGFRDPLAPEELLRLACEPGVRSRLVRVRGGPRPFSTTEGPQTPRRLARLRGQRDWTLLVREVDRHLPAVARLLDAFAFLPAWRLDDVMVSLAAPGGGVGPHRDSYDVFLIQGLGRRRWQIDPAAPPELRPGLDLRVLRRFRPRGSWVLEPGDMLYLPPGLAHHGVALEECLTYSIGFLAPTAAEVGARALQRIVSALPQTRFADAGRRRVAHAGQIASRDVGRFQALLRAAIGPLRHPDLPGLLGEILTEPRGRPPEPGRSLTPAALRRRVAAGLGLRRAPGSHAAFTRERGRVRLFVDGEARTLPPALAFAAPLLCDRRELRGAALQAALRRPGFAALAAELVSAGAFELVR